MTLEFFRQKEQTSRQSETAVRDTASVHKAWGILGVGRLAGHKPLFAKKTVESGNGTGVATPGKFHPEDNQTVMRIASAHISDKFDFLRSVLVGVMMWPSGTIPEGFNRAIISPSPSVNILTVGFIFYGSFRDTMLFSVFN